MQYHTEEEQDEVELGTVSLHSTFCRLLRQSVQLSAMGASAVGFPLASLKYRKFATWERKGGRASERGAMERVQFCTFLHRVTSSPAPFAVSCASPVSRYPFPLSLYVLAPMYVLQGGEQNEFGSNYH